MSYLKTRVLGKDVYQRRKNISAYDATHVEKKAKENKKRPETNQKMTHLLVYSGC